MKLLKRITSVMLTFIMVFLSTSESFHALVEAASATKTTVIQNNFLKVTVDNETGRYGIRTVEGQPIRKNDDNVNLLFQGDDPETSFTTFRIDGTDYIYGNKYKFDNSHYSETTAPKIVQNSNGTKQLEMIWKIKGVEIKQILMLYTDSKDAVNSGNVNIRYEVNNRSNAQVEVGSRILLDTMVGGNDGPQFQIGTAYKSPLQVERKLVHNPEADAGIPEEDRAYFKIPSYWVMRDKLDLSNPQATNVVAYGFNNFAEQNINIVDEMIVGHWNGLANTKWDYTIHPNLDFTRDTNDYGTADSAVAFYWNPDKVAAGGFQSFETVYGLGELTAPDKVFSIRYVDQIQQLATAPLKEGETVPSNYVDNGVFTVTAEVENLQAYNMEHSKIEVEMTLESGLSFVKQDERGRDVLDASGKPVLETDRSKMLEFKKSATPDEAAMGIEPKYKPGDAITATFRVQAKGRPWPVTKEYMISARSPETQGKIEGVEDEGIRAQYESTRTNFILLPPVGEATATYAYALSPKELFSTDVKYVTVNLSNIEAYNTGNDTTAPNFDLFLKNKANGDRYKVNMQDAVVMQPTDDGFSGAMRITYRGGDQVDKGGNVLKSGLGPDLPLGEYQVEIDYKGDAGGDEEIAALYDITTPQSFLVTDNNETRIREAGVLALYRESVDVSGLSSGGSVKGELLAQLNSLFPSKPFKDGSFLYSAVTSYKQTKALIGAASKAVDPSFDLKEFMDDAALKETPMYAYKLFATEKEYEAFEKEVDNKDAKPKIDREILVTVRGMIKQVGTGKDETVIVDTKTEPAIINDAVAYKGKDLAFVRGKLDIFGKSQPTDMPFLDTLFIKGDGTLSVASSGFVFHKGEWTLDFFNGFTKSLGDGGFNPTNLKKPSTAKKDNESKHNPEDSSLNGSLKWALGAVGDRVNPLRQIMIEDVYFNKQSLFGAPSFAIDGFGFSFNDFILREGGISFGGSLSLKVVSAEIKNVIFNSAGFYGVDASLGFGLENNMGLFEPAKKKKDEPESPSGEITIKHVVQGDGEGNTYGLKFDAQLKNMLGVQIEFALKKVKDGRILPDVIGFGATLPSPGILITGATYLNEIRGAVRELADTIAGGTAADPFPLTIQAGVGLRFGIAPAYFFGDIDLTVKRTGLKIEGKMDFSADADAEPGDRLPMLTKALLEAQWVTPWFVRVEAAMDIGGWDIIIGKAGIFVGQNLEKNRTDFEGYIGSKVQIPNSVPVVGGMPLSSMFLGVNNDKVWGSIGILFISLGITYYWSGGIEFGTSSDQLPDGMIQLVVDDPELGPRLMVIGEGVETLATSAAPTAEDESQEIIYREVAEGVKIVENGSVNVGVGGITVTNGGRIHEIPMGAASGNAIIEMEYTSKDRPQFRLQDAAGKDYPVVFTDFADPENVNPKANAFTQYIPASDISPDPSKLNAEVDIRRAYVIIPENEAKKGGTWKLTAVSPVETKLMNVPTLPQLNEVNLAKDSSNGNKFTASWKVANAAEGDTVNLYLAEDAVTTEKTIIEGQEVLSPGDPGMLIAKDVPVGAGGSVSNGVTSGSKVIDVTNVTLMGNPEDIRGLLRQGNYYLRAELKSSATFGTKTSPQKFELIDPFAPQVVSDVSIVPAGNGLFALSFKPGAKKSGHSAYEHSFVIDAQSMVNGKLESYAPFGEILYTEEELQPYWNASTGKYEGILIGGWKALSTSDEVNTTSLEGTVTDVTKLKYVGLEVGTEYVVGVTAATVPTEAADKNQNYHYAERQDSSKKLLPVPKLPDLKLPAELNKGKVNDTGNYINLLTSETNQNLTLTSTQSNVMVEVFNADKSIATVALKNKADGGSEGVLNLDQFQTDGPFALELRARNMTTKDISVTMLYMTVDTIAPVLYLDQPVTGERAANGEVRVAGTTTTGTLLKANYTVNQLQPNGTYKEVVVPTEIEVDPLTGSFSGTVKVNSDEPSVALSIVAEDGAKNQNTAVVDITNAGYKVPVALVLKVEEDLQPGELSKVEAYLKVSDGKDANGKPKFKDEPLSAEELKNLTYTVAVGDAIALSPDGKLTALATGSSLIEAEYKVSEGVTLKGMAAAEITVPKPTEIGKLTVSASSIYGDSNRTKITVTSAGDMTGQQIAYKVYRGNAVSPGFGDNVSTWSLLPLDGVISALPGDVVVVAKRTSTDKKVMATGTVTANIWSAPSDPGPIPNPGPGGGPGVIVPPAEEEKAPETAAQVTVNGQPVATEWNGLTAVIKITDKEASTGSDITIASADTAARAFSIQVEQSVVKQAVAAKKKVAIEVPMGQLILTPENLAAVNGELVVNIGQNGAADQQAMKTIADQQGFTLMAAGQGATISVNLPAGSWTPAPAAKIAIPSPIAAKEITAIVLKDAAGNWTTVPWKLDNSGTTVNVQLTGEGSLYFIRNQKNFKDMPAGWGKEGIAAASAKLFVLGKSADTFDPAGKVTRAEYPTILLRVAGLMNKQAPSAGFSDVGNSSWYNRSVSIAAQLGIVTGLEGGKYAPQATLTRMEAMTMLGRLLTLVNAGSGITDAEVTSILSGFTDKDKLPAWARQAVALSIKNGIILGEGNKVNPASPLTREQAAAIAIRLDELITAEQ